MRGQKNEELISLIFTAHRLIRERFASHGRIDPMSIARLKIFKAIGEKTSPTMKEIAESLYITYPSATAIVNRLVKIGELQRIFDTNDRRTIHIEITSKGREVYKELHKKSTEKMSKILEKLNVKEKSDFAAILKKIIY